MLRLMLKPLLELRLTGVKRYTVVYGESNSNNNAPVALLVPGTRTLHRSLPISRKTRWTCCNKTKTTTSTQKPSWSKESALTSQTCLHGYEICLLPLARHGRFLCRIELTHLPEATKRRRTALEYSVRRGRGQDTWYTTTTRNVFDISDDAAKAVGNSIQHEGNWDLASLVFHLQRTLLSFSNAFNKSSPCPEQRRRASRS
eukprot:scaffold10368_cov180-Amphora_coffeaeformis.AAC.2